MATLTPEAVVKLWIEILNEGRKNGFGMKNSNLFLKYIDTQYDKQFKN